MSTMGYLQKFLDSGTIRLALMAGMFWMAYELTAWAMAFGSTALSMKADLMGSAAVIAATAAAPIAILTLLTNKYMDTRSKEDGSTDR